MKQGVFNQLIRVYEDKGLEAFLAEKLRLVEGLKQRFKPGDSEVLNLAWNVTGKARDKRIQKEYELALELQELVAQMEKAPENSRKVLRNLQARSFHIALEIRQFANQAKLTS